MNGNQIKETVDFWIDEQELPSRPDLTPIRRFDDLYPKDEEEREAYKDFMEWAMSRDMAVLLTLPKPVHQKDFWSFEDDLSISFPYSSMDYQRYHPFNKYTHKVRKIFEKVEELAIRHSCIRQQEGKANTVKRFEILVKDAFRDKVTMLLASYQKHPHLVNKKKLFDRIAELNAKIRICRRIWQEHAYSA